MIHRHGGRGCEKTFVLRGCAGSPGRASSCSHACSARASSGAVLGTLFASRVASPRVRTSAPGRGTPRGRPGPGVLPSTRALLTRAYGRRGVKRRLSLSIRDCVSPPSAPRPPPPCARRLSLEARAPSPHSRVHLCVVHKVHSVTICVACPSCASRAGVYRSRMTAGRGNYTGYWAARAVRRTRTQPPMHAPMAMRRRRPWQLARIAGSTYASRHTGSGP